MKTTVQLKQTAAYNQLPTERRPSHRQPAVLEINEIEFASQEPVGSALAAHINEIARRLCEECK